MFGDFKIFLNAWGEKESRCVKQSGTRYGIHVKQTRFNRGLHFKLLIVTENLEICFGCGASVIWCRVRVSHVDVQVLEIDTGTRTITGPRYL